MKIQTPSYLLALTLSTSLSFATYAAPKHQPRHHWSSLKSSDTKGIDIEFRKGDRLPLRVLSRGDFLESTTQLENVLEVKRDFWMRFEGDRVTISLDGIDFKPIQDLVAGNLSVSFGSDANGTSSPGIDVSLESVLKNR